MTGVDRAVPRRSRGPSQRALSRPHAGLAVFALALLLPWHPVRAADTPPAPEEIKPYAPVTVRVTAGGQDKTIVLYGHGRDHVSYSQEGDTSGARNLLEISRIEEVRFPLNIDYAALEKADASRDWLMAIRVCSPSVTPALPYLDLPENNAMDWALRLGNYMYRAAEMDLRRATNDVSRSRAEEEFKAAYDVYRQAAVADWSSIGKVCQVKRLLCLIRLNKPKTAAHYLEEVAEPLPGDAAYGIYFLVKAEIALSAGDFRAAMLAAVKSLSFENKDIDTFPDALMLSAVCYEELQEWHRARDVYYEVAMVLPNTDWSELARKRLAFIASKGLTSGEEKHPIENVFFAWDEDMNKQVADFLAAKETAFVPEGGTNDTVIDQDFDAGTDKDLDAPASKPKPKPREP